MTEVRVELLLGRKVRAPDGRVVGRIEEIVAEPTPGECRVTEIHLGPDAFLERLSVTASALPGFAWLSRHARGLRVPWEKIDLCHPGGPRLLCSPAELERLENV